MPTILRPSRALFRFSGPDAHKLLFDVVTARLVEAEGPPVWWALLSPQGKIQAEGLSIWRDGAFWLDTHVSVADDFLKRMKMYRLRAQVAIDDLRETHAVGSNSAAARSHVIGTREEATGWGAPDDSYDRGRIAAGVAELGADFTPDTLFPHDIGMDLLAGVDFQKGCYIGQEVVSRMQHRGTARRRPVIIGGLSPEAGVGSAVLVGAREAGTVGHPVDGQALAIVRLDRFDGSAVTVAGSPVTVSLPEWATYRLGESAAAE
jgi:folate-binding protein YgfZ